MKSFHVGDIVRIKWTNRVAPSLNALVQRLAINNIPLVVVKYIGESRPFYSGHMIPPRDVSYDCWEVLVDSEILVVSERDLTHRGPFNCKPSELR